MPQSFPGNRIPERPSPAHFLVRLLRDRDDATDDRAKSASKGSAGEFAWATGDLDGAEKEGLVKIIRRPLLDAAGIEAWQNEQRDKAARQRARLAGLALPADGVPLPLDYYSDMIPVQR
jgi:hypothetical protein